MANLIVVSDNPIAAATALLLSAKGHNVAYVGSALSPGDHTVQLLGEQRTVRLEALASLDPHAETVGIVFCEGEDAAAGVAKVFGTAQPHLLVMVGGGITGAVASARAADAHGFDRSSVLVVGGFVVGGDASAVTSEKRGVLAGFLQQAGTSPVVRQLARDIVPQVAIGSVISAALSGLNAFLHVPPMIFNAMSVERGDDARFYVEGFGDSVGRLLACLDEDRRALGNALGCELLPVETLLDRYLGSAGMRGASAVEKIRSFTPYHGVKLPTSFEHRFLAHEVQSTLAPMAELARLSSIAVPTIEAVVRIAEVLAGHELTSTAQEIAKGFLELSDHSRPGAPRA